MDFVIGKTYKGIGYCGMTKDVEVVGVLTEYRKEHDHAILQDKRNRLCAVILKTLEEVVE